MIRNLRTGLIAALALGGLLALGAPLTADDDVTGDLTAFSADVQIYNDHLVTLASPFMEGRVPGSRGMEIAREYCEYYLRQAGLEAPFEVADRVGERTYRQAFPLGGSTEVGSHSVQIAGAEFTPGEDFTATTMGGSGEVTGELVFVGYSIQDGPDGYSSFNETDDFAGKVVLMLRFEPVAEDGTSRWSERAWSGAAGFGPKLRAIRDRNPAAVIIVNTPGTFDPRADALIDADTSSGRPLPAPVLNMTTEAAERLLEAAGAPSLMELRKAADAGRAVRDLGAEVTVAAELVREDLYAQNVGGLLPGKGDLADELVIIGAHLDHLGQGYFGSRGGAEARGKLHPGADDNASGSAAILMLADRMAEDYAAMGEDANARSVLFMLFDAEESGLNGSRYYVNNPIWPWEQHALMINFDMIGRITNNRLSVSGVTTAQGMEDWLQPLFDASPLEIVSRGPSGGGSDHLPFLQKQLPILFGIIADFHADYHTPADTSYKINRVGAVQTIDLFHKILLTSATRAEPFIFNDPSAGAPQQQGPRMGSISVRFGISPGNYEDNEPGIAVASVTEGGSAAEGGIKAGDRLMSWNGDEIESVMWWMGKLADHKPGDKVEVGLIREGEKMTVTVTLQARPQRGGDAG
ncbi:MAG: M28 family peptidase [Phycisphaerales bacterium JB039]